MFRIIAAPILAASALLGSEAMNDGGPASGKTHVGEIPPIALAALSDVDFWELAANAKP